MVKSHLDIIVNDVDSFYMSTEKQSSERFQLEVVDMHSYIMGINST